MYYNLVFKLCVQQAIVFILIQYFYKFIHIKCTTLKKYIFNESCLKIENIHNLLVETPTDVADSKFELSCN